MEEVEDKPTSSRNVELHSLADTSQENTDIITAPTDNHSSIEAINSLGDKNIVEHDTHFQETNFSEIESKSTRVSDEQSIGQDEHPLTDDSTSTPKEEKVHETEENHLGAIAADSVLEALEDIQDGGSTVTANGDVDHNLMELSTSSSVTEELQIDPKGCLYACSCLFGFRAKV